MAKPMFELHNSFRRLSESAIARALLNLLETKHLYQSISLDADLRAALDTVLTECPTDAAPRLGADLSLKMNQAWDIADSYSVRLPAPSSVGGNPPLCATVHTAKLFCRACDRREAFNVVSRVNLIDPTDSAAFEVTSTRVLQLADLALQCQSCKGVSEHFIVRREGLRLRLDGRSPHEHVELPTVIPKPHNRYVRDAIIAQQSGQSLAALFTLRVFVEEYARRADRTRQVDAALEAYAHSLPQDFKDRFPSLGHLYSLLSEAIHDARPDSDLFVRCLQDLVEHFDARRLYKLDKLTP